MPLFESILNFGRGDELDSGKRNRREGSWTHKFDGRNELQDIAAERLNSPSGKQKKSSIVFKCVGLGIWVGDLGESVIAYFKCLMFAKIIR